MIRPASSQHRLAALSGRYGEAGLPLTSQRRTLLEVLAGRLDHPTVDQIYSEVVERLPEVSRTTVYRSLEILTERGLIQRIEHPGSAVRFDPNVLPHHHFLCTRCGALADLELEAVEGYERLRLVDERAGSADEVTVLVRGTCTACLTKGASE